MADRHKTGGMDRITLRLAVFGILMIAAFVALFSRLWYLQVLAAGNYQKQAQENRVRFVHSEPFRGRIVDRNGVVLVDNRLTLAVTLDRQILDRPHKRRKVIRSVSDLLDVKPSQIKERLTDATVSPYKPVAVVNDVEESDAAYIEENQEDFPGVGIDRLPVRIYPKGHMAAHVLGYVNEISPEELESDHFKKVRPPYTAGDIVGKFGVEYNYDRFLRGEPRIEKVIVNSSGEVIGSKLRQEEDTGDDLVLSLNADIQKLSEQALEAGVMAARGAGYQAPGAAAIVMDPSNGDVLAMASFPDYDPRILADGITNKEFKTLNDPTQNAWLNRAIQAQRQPGSTYKVVTAGAAISTGVADAYTQLDCPPSKIYPPEGGPGSQEFNNWTSRSFGYVGFPTSLEISCDTFYYELGWRMETTFDEQERFQKYARAAGIGHDTGVDLPNEADGRVPDRAWCREIWKATKDDDIPTCGTKDGPIWLPGFSVNMAIGQGDVIATPLQMAVTYAAIANGGTVWRPQIGAALARTNETGDLQIEEAFDDRKVDTLPLDATEIGVIRDGLELVIAGSEGTARGAFAGFPLSEFPLAGKTGTAELGESELNDAWFVAYGPSDAPRYVVSVYVEKAGHGGESAAPIARQILEGIFGIDKETEVRLGPVDLSG